MNRPLRAALLVLFVLLAYPVAAEEWRYRDGAGNEVVLPEPPRRIIAHSTVAAALIPYGIRPVGILRDGPPSLDRALEGVDVSDIPTVSRGWFEINAEAVLGLEPDIIITEYSLTEHLYQGGTHEDAVSERLKAIAPIVGFPRGVSILESLRAYEDFARSLGADTQAPAIAADKARFERSAAGLKAAIAQKPGLVVAAVSPGSSGLSIGLPAYFGELNDWRGWGLDLLSPPATSGTSYLSLAWENADSIAADILLLDDRWESPALDRIIQNPIGRRLPAVQAGQVGDWPAEWIRSYAAYAAEIEELTVLILRSDPALVD